jgi:superfamily II DNA or RNA helicase
VAFAVGDQVQARNDPTRIGIIQALGPRHAGEQFYDVFWGGLLGIRSVPEPDLLPHLTVERPSEALRAGRFATISEFQRAITVQRLVRDSPLRNNIYAFNASRTRFFPYQFKPLLKLLESRRNRLLLCDEVGLGKTIEAGLILIEMRARQTMRLCLVVCPSALTQKWRMELKQRFGEDFRVLRSPELRAFFDEYEADPDRTGMNAIVSVESLRRPEVRSRIEELRIPFDLTIVDEAHSARNYNQQRHAVQLVLDTSATAILLTATPVHLGHGDLFSLLNLLDPEDFPDLTTAERRFEDNQHIVRAQALMAADPPDTPELLLCLARAATSPWMTKHALVASVTERIANLPSLERPQVAEERSALARDLAELNLLGHILTRTRRRDVHEMVAVRRARSIEIDFSDRERALYLAVSLLITKEAEERGATGAGNFWRLHTPQRRMASSIQAMVDHFRAEAADAPLANGDTLGDDDGTDEPPFEVKNGELSSALLRRAIGALVADWPDDGADAKYDALRSLLNEHRRDPKLGKVLLFATFRGSLRYLQRRLREDGLAAELISGEVAPDDRNRAIARFRNDPGVLVLLSSRVGSEGLDFQFCHTVVNYDLPWNPMEVEQRIGRVDRIGQASDSIAIINFWTRGTIEERILRRLYDRIGIFERSVGALEAILGEIGGRDWQDLLDPRLSEAEQMREVERLERVFEQKRHEIATLDESSANFVGVDAFFEQEVAAIKSNRRYVTPAQLLLFLKDFLKRECPRTRLDYKLAEGEGVLVPDARFRDFLQRSEYGAECGSIVTGVGVPIPITLESEIADRRPSVEFLSLIHPAVRAVADWAKAQSRPAAYQVTVKTSRLSQGIYFFFVYRATVRAARSYTTLESVILDEPMKEACSADDAEAILGEMVETGWSETAGLLELAPDLLAEAAQAAERRFLDRLQSLRVREQKSNAEFVAQRVASLEQSYRKDREKTQELLTRGIAAKKDERYLRMMRGKLANREADYLSKKAELDNLRQVATEHEEVAAGVLEVV